jgi:hypothetical protein
MSLEFARSCVAAGVRVLDTQLPGWFRSVDWERLSFMSPKLDVLGQLYPNYWAGLKALGIDVTDREAPAKLGLATYLGTPLSAARTTAGELEAAWREVGSSAERSSHIVR